MDIVSRLKEAGFSRVMVLDGAECGADAQSLVLALWTYQAEKEPSKEEAWVHPYYPASHKAYKAARAIAEEATAAGIPVAVRDDIRLKPIFARLPGLTQGRNTLSYLEGAGSRFHAKLFAVDAPLQPTVHLSNVPHQRHCGSCTWCMEACPTGAITVDGFVMERCLRYWMLLGKPTPEPLRKAMGNRLVGCDQCQRCCPHNPLPTGQTGGAVPLLRLLTDPKPMAAELRDVIGANLTLPNRLLAQACLLAGNSGRADLLEAVKALESHPSPVVREHAAWAAKQLE